jgi:hypothetical protein
MYDRKLFSRLKRAMLQNGELLRKSRESSRWYCELGEFYSVDVDTGLVGEKHIDLELKAIELQELVRCSN